MRWILWRGKDPFVRSFTTTAAMFRLILNGIRTLLSPSKLLERLANPAGVDAIPSLLFDGAKLNFTFKLGFVPEKYWRAILRVAYLAAFWRFGYAYVLSEGAAQVRRVLDGESPPSEVILEAYPDAELPLPALVNTIDITETGSLLLVLLRFRASSTRWIAVLLPGESGCAWHVLANVAAYPPSLLLRLRLGESADVSVRFDHEPIKRLRETRIAPFKQANPAG